MRDICVAAVQFEHRLGDKAYNMAKVREFATGVGMSDVRLMVFPECCISGYWGLRKMSRSELDELAEPIPEGPSCQALLEMAADLGMSLGAGWVERDGDRLFNSYVVVTPEQRWYRHRKLHCFIHPEISSGDQYTVFDLEPGIRAGVLICYDNNLVENVRITALMGAEILIAPHQTGGCRTRSPHAMGAIDLELWRRRRKDPESIEAELRGPKGRGWLMRWLPARAHDNGLFVIFSNGVGIDDDEVRTGNAMILDPYGRILTETWEAGDDMVTADLEADLLPTSTGRLWLEARRPELYGSLTQRTGIEKSTREVRFGRRG